MVHILVFEMVPTPYLFPKSMILKSFLLVDFCIGKLCLQLLIQCGVDMCSGYVFAVCWVQVAALKSNIPVTFVMRS